MTTEAEKKLPPSKRAPELPIKDSPKTLLGDFAVEGRPLKETLFVDLIDNLAILRIRTAALSQDKIPEELKKEIQTIKDEIQHRADQHIPREAF